MKVYITACSGVDKTTVVNELRNRGFAAYDADDRELNLTRLEIRQTVWPAEWPKGYVDWHYYSWNANEERLKELLTSNKPVFVAGFLGNQEAIYQYFDVLIALTLDRAERELRLLCAQNANLAMRRKYSAPTG